MKLIETIPPETLGNVRTKKIVLAGFGAGPGFVAQKTEKFEPPVDFPLGMAWLERWKDTFKRTRLEFEDGSRLVFWGSKFERYEDKNPRTY